MCGRYYIAIDEDELRDISEEAEQIVYAYSEPIPLKTKGEIFPTDIVPVRTAVGKCEPMKWGFVNFDKKIVINARSETALQKPMFKKPIIESRCLIPASGYYEWKKEEGKKIKYQFYGQGGPIYLAGCCRREKGSPTRHFVILTRQAVNGLEEFHDRMPVIIPREHMEEWLDPAATYVGGSNAAETTGAAGLGAVSMNKEENATVESTISRMLDSALLNLSYKLAA